MDGSSRCVAISYPPEGLVIGGDAILHNLAGFLGGGLTDHQILCSGLEQGRAGGLLIAETDQEDVGGRILLPAPAPWR